jgi:hypothetical protein
MGGVPDVAAISDPSAAEVTLDRARDRLLAELCQPASAAGLAERVSDGQPRCSRSRQVRRSAPVGVQILSSSA